MIKAGITGGIGSGKTVVAMLFSVMGIPVYEADKESKRLTNSSDRIKKALIARFGNDIYTVGEEINKQKLSSFIFSDKKHLDYVNHAIHPVVLDDFLLWADKQDSETVAIESAILFESGFDTAVDVVVAVWAPEEIRIDRVKRRDSLSDSQIRQRMANQWTDEEKCDRSHFVVYNDGKKALIPQVESIIKAIKGIHT